MQDDFSRRRASVAPIGSVTRHAIRSRRKLEAELPPAIGYHVTLRLSDDRVIAATRADRRVAACTMIRHGRTRRLLACAVVDTHAHALLLCSRAEAGEYAGRAATSLRLALNLEVAFEPARIKPIRDQRHLANTFDYVFRQDEHHAVSIADFHDGTNLPDLVGLRVNGAYSRKLLHEQLPRVSERSLLERFQVDWSRPLDFDSTLLPEATAAAIGRLCLKGRAACNVAARRAAADVAGLHLNMPAFARLFRVDVRTAFRMRAAGCDRAIARAIELQMRLRAALRSRGSQE